MCLPALFRLKMPELPTGGLYGRSLHICSSVKTGVNVSRQRTQKLPLVSCVVVMLVSRINDCHAGDVGKLLGAKWKELDDEEKKVSDLYAYTLQDTFINCLYSLMLSELCKTEQKKKRPNMRWAIKDSIGLSYTVSAYGYH